MFSIASSLNPDVTPETIEQTICTKGWTKTVRPSTRYTNLIKFAAMESAGIPKEDSREWALDHAIPLTLGGSPTLLDNLQLLSAADNYRKSRIEVKLQCLVCSGQMALHDAQTEVWFDWEEAYQKYATMKCSR